MEYPIVFPLGVQDNPGRIKGHIRRFSSQSMAVLLCWEESSDSLILGDVRRLPSRSIPVFDSQTLAVLGVSASDCTDFEIFCRMSIPDTHPQDAGFDLSQLIIACKKTGKAVEVYFPYGEFLPLRTLYTIGRKRA
jgi:hypothetical protein